MAEKKEDIIEEYIKARKIQEKETEEAAAKALPLILERKKELKPMWAVGDVKGKKVCINLYQQSMGAKKDEWCVELNEVEEKGEKLILRGSPSSRNQEFFGPSEKGYDASRKYFNKLAKKYRLEKLREKPQFSL